MVEQPRLFKVNSAEQKALDMDEVDFAAVGLQERTDIQEWIAANPSILSSELLIIAKEFNEFDQIRDRLDLLAVGRDGQLVIIELKRDDTGEDVHWQAIKYASYMHGVTTEEIVRMLAQHRGCEPEEARQKIIEHTESEEELDRLNHSQCIILVSHRFAPQVTSAALWLNEQANRDLVTCVQLTPYKDSTSGDLYMLANTIIPVPGAEHYFISLRNRPNSDATLHGTNPNRTDSVTQFCKKIRSRIIESVPEDLQPNKNSWWAGKYSNLTTRYYHMWYAEPLWGNWNMSFQIELTPPSSEEEETSWSAWIGLGYKDIPEELKMTFGELNLGNDIETGKTYIGCYRTGESLDDSFCDQLSQVLQRFIETMTPVVREFTDDLEEKHN